MNSQDTKVEQEKSIFLLSDKTYEHLKFSVTLLLPALATLYFALGSIWGFPFVEQIVGTIAALITFLGIFMRKSETKYDATESKYDGAINIYETPQGKKVYQLDIGDRDPEDMDWKNTARFRINQ